VRSASPDAWNLAHFLRAAIRSTKAQALAVSRAHEVSKPYVRVVSWSAERIRSDNHRRATVRTRKRRAARRLSRGWPRGPISGRRRRYGFSEQGPREGDASGPARIREESRLADADEAGRQNVLDEAAEKLHRQSVTTQRHRR
jgi:hypothetical protein